MEQQKFYDDKKSKRISVMEDKNTNKKYVLIDGRVYMSYNTNDKEAERIAIVQLSEIRICKDEEIANAFGVHINSIKNYINRFREEGYRGLLTQSRGPIGAWKVTAKNRSKILWIVFHEGTTNSREIKDKLKEMFKEEISENSIRRVLIEDGLIEGIKIEKRNKQEEINFNGQMELNLLEVKNYGIIREDRGEYLTTRDIKEIRDGDTKDLNTRFKKKMLSYYSEMEREYLRRLEKGQYSIYGAGLLLVPMLARYKFIDTIKETIKISTYEGYKSEQLMLTLFYFSLYEFKSIEDFKTVYSDEFGVLLGRTSSPSIYTIRRFLHKVRKLKKGEELIYKFGVNYIESNLVKWGTIYIDDHFLPYYGIEEITKGYFTVRDRVLRGSYNFIAVDKDYNPLIFLIRESREDLIKKIPELIEKAKKIARVVGISEEEINKLTVIFDRGGKSSGIIHGIR
jgi:transposase